MQWRPSISDWFEFAIVIFLLSVSAAIILITLRIFFVGFQ